MSSLAAHLFAAKSLVLTEVADMDVTTSFNSSLSTTGTDLRPVLDQVLATQIYGAMRRGWTDGEYAFPGISLHDLWEDLNMTASIDGLAAYLVCDDMCNSGYSANLEGGLSAAGLDFEVNDRGCNITPDIQITDTASVYLQTFIQNGCSPVTGSRRSGLIAGHCSPRSSTVLSNFSFISCIPQY